MNTKTSWIVVGLICLVSVVYLLASVQKTVAQTVDPDQQKKLDWDNSFDKEKIGRLTVECTELQKEVKNLVAAKLPKLKVSAETFIDPTAAALGRKGQTHFSLGWKRKSSEFRLNVVFLFNPEETIEMHRKGMNTLSMGELFPAPDFLGQPSVLIKNVNYNTMLTVASIHFVRGRLMISTYLQDQKKTSAENEKALIEFVRVIEPALKAKLTIQEV